MAGDKGRKPPHGETRRGGHAPEQPAAKKYAKGAPVGNKSAPAPSTKPAVPLSRCAARETAAAAAAAPVAAAAPAARCSNQPRLSRTAHPAAHTSSTPIQNKQTNRKEQKDASLAKKIRFRRNFATIQEAVQLWERLRPKETSAQEKSALVDQIVGMVRACVRACVRVCERERAPSAAGVVAMAP